MQTGFTLETCRRHTHGRCLAFGLAQLPRTPPLYPVYRPSALRLADAKLAAVNNQIT
jgi:hypothetical protein